MSIATEQPTSVSVTVGDDEIVFETGKLAKQADGAVSSARARRWCWRLRGRMEAREGADFFPLTVDVEERMYAAGKIPGGFFKREGRPTERAILTARMIDRPIRPLWPKGYRNEVQVICTTLSADLVTPHDILCINGASAALMISPLPFMGPVGAVRIGHDRRRTRRRPDAAADQSQTHARPDRRRHEAGPDDGRGRRRGGARGDAARGARAGARARSCKLCEAQEELREQAGKPKWLDPELTDRAQGPHGDRDPRAHPGARAARGRRGRRGARGRAAPRSRWTRPRRTSLRQIQVRSSLAAVLESHPDGGGRGHRCASSSRPTCAR